MSDEKVKSTTISVVLSPEEDCIIEDYRWANRLTRSELLRNILKDWFERNGFVIPNPDTGSPTE